MSNLHGVIRALMRSPLLWGLAATAGFFVAVSAGVVGAMLGKGAQAFVDRYCASHPVEYVEVAMFFVGMAALVIKWRWIGEQLLGLKRSWLGEVPPGGQTAEDCDGLLVRLEEAPVSQRGSYLLRRLHDAVSFVRRKGSAESLDRELKHLSELDDAKAHGSFGLVRVIIWAIPILGFLGTVIGITMAIANLNPAQLEDSLGEVVGALAVAFDTTALALALSIVLMFTQFAVDRADQNLLGRVDEAVQEELSARFNEAATGGDPQVAAVRRMSETLVQAAGNLVGHQAELWQDTIQRAQEKWQQSLHVAHDQVESALQSAVSQALELHANRLSEAAESLAGRGLEQWEGLQQSLVQHGELMTRQQQELIHQSEMLRGVVDATVNMATLEETLNRNLASVQATGRLDATLHHLGEVLGLLERRLRRPVPDEAHEAAGEPINPTGRAA